MFALFIMRYDLIFLSSEPTRQYFVIQLKIHRYAHRGCKLALFLFLP